jgi:hypothetical protein
LSQISEIPIGRFLLSRNLLSPKPAANPETAKKE